MSLAGIVLVLGLALVGCPNPADNNNNQGDDTTATVTAVTVNPGTVGVGRGGTYTFGATVAGTNNPSQAVRWSIDEEDRHEQTNISTGGVLSIAADEPRDTLTVRATSTFDDAISGTATVTVANIAEGDTLAEQLAWLRTNAQNGNSYTLEISGNEDLSPAQAALPTGRSGLTVTLSGGGTMRNVSLSENGILFTVGSGVTLVLGNNVALIGRSDNDNHMVRITSGGTLVMNTGSRIVDNTNATTTIANRGGAVRVNTGGTFTMNGGEISGNASTASFGHGAGVHVAGGGTFNMRGGVISGNTALESSSDGGGVFNAGIFRISDGIIYGDAAPGGLANTATRNGSALLSDGTAATAQRGTFTGSDFESLGDLNTSNATIHIVSGVFQRPERTGNLAEQLAWMREHSFSDGSYVINITSNESMAPQELPAGRTNLTITLSGGGTMRNVSLSENGILFTVGSGVTLVLDNYVALIGRSDNDNHMVRITTGGTLVMNAGSRIAGNTNVTTTSTNRGGAVRVNTGGTFTMNGGEISGNASAASFGHGAGVHVAGGGTFNMRGGVISGNTALESFSDGGGVFNAGTFRISDGIIHGNTATGGLANAVAGSGATLFNSGTAAIAQRGTFTNDIFDAPLGTLATTDATLHVISGVLQMPERTGTLAEQLAWLRNYSQSGGNYVIYINADESIGPQELPIGRTNLTITLRGNVTTRNISLSSNGRLFTIGSGVTLVLDSNVALIGRSGPGFADNNNDVLVRIDSGGALVMNANARIADNVNASVLGGGGVRVNSGGTFTMNNGVISDNSSVFLTLGDGGGVHVASGGMFYMHGGTISDNVAGNNGGGVFNAAGGIFRMSGGIINGSDSVGLGNTAGTGAFAGAALFNNGIAEHGTFNGGFGGVGDLITTGLTIEVGNGVLLRPVGGIQIPDRTGDLAQQFAWLRSFAQSDGDYVIELNANETIDPQTLPMGRIDLTITLRGMGVMRNVSLSSSGNLFTVGSGVTLVLDANVALVGRTAGIGGVLFNNLGSVVIIDNGGTLVMNSGSRVTGNSSDSSLNSSGVRVNNGGTFVMNGGEISGNASSATTGDGGGVHIASGGAFDMRGGTISGNSANRNGGGVFNAGTFRISNGTVYGNEATLALPNTATGGAALFVGGTTWSPATTQRGTFDPITDTFTETGVLETTDSTIQVTNGELQY